MRSAVAGAGLLSILLSGREAFPATSAIRLVEILGSWQGDGAVQFVELALVQDGATQVSGARLTFTSTTSGKRRALQLPSDVAVGTAGSRILVATERAQEVLGVTADFVLPDGLLGEDMGRVCYQVTADDGSSMTVDCVAFGGYAGDNGDFGRPLRGGPDNRTIVRVATTGTNRADWDTVLTPTPQNNAGVSATVASLCGDEHVDSGEECDGGDLGGSSCGDFGNADGDLTCHQCHFDKSGCVTCGNGTIDDEEQCDQDALGDTTCEAVGFTGGEMDCSTSCKLTTDRCDPTFYVPGGGTGPECTAEWQITNSAQRPGRDGAAALRQSCDDGDDGCDADGATGQCTFLVAVCFDRTDPRLTKGDKVCRRDPVTSWTLKAPADDANAAALLEAVSALAPSHRSGGTVTFDAPFAGAGACGATVPVVVAAGQRVVLKARTAASGGRVDVDALRLICR